MELSFKELSKREVVNVTDGKCLGHIVDLTLDFPKGIMSGITVPSKKSIFNCLGWYEKIFIESYKIKKIGKDVILVDLTASKPHKPQKNSCPPLCGGTPSSACREISNDEYE